MHCKLQEKLHRVTWPLEGVICIADDILVFGEGDDYKQAQKDHDRRLIALMERCIQQNIKLNAVKLQFKLKEVKFMENIYSYIVNYNIRLTGRTKLYMILM